MFCVSGLSESRVLVQVGSRMQKQSRSRAELPNVFYCVSNYGSPVIMAKDLFES